MKRPLIVLAAVVVLVVLVIGITQLGSPGSSGGRGPSLRAAQGRLVGSPAPLRALHRDANRLLAGKGLDARIAALRGYPIVVNVWGSWCVPCRQEFPLFQRLSARLGKRVAFLGVDTQDPAKEAARFLRGHPVSYPSYQDLDKAIFNRYGLVGVPSTIFYDARGRKAFLHSGVYRREADLRADIKRYAGA